VSPDILNAFKNSNRRKLSRGWIIISMQTFDKNGDGTELVGFLQALKLQKVPRKGSSVKVEKL